MEKRYEPGKKVSLRLTKDLPRYLFDYLNENEIGNREMLDLLLEGVQSRMANENKGIFLPYYDLPPERREEIARNDDFLQTVVKVADWLIRGGGPPQVMVTQPAAVEEKQADPEPEPLAPGEIDVSEDGAINQFLQQFEDDDDDDDD